MTKKPIQYPVINFERKLIEPSQSLIESYQSFIETIVRNQSHIDEVATSITSAQRGIEKLLHGSNIPRMFEVIQQANSRLSIELTSLQSLVQKFNAASEVIALNARGIWQFEAQLKIIANPTIANSIISKFESAISAYIHWNNLFNPSIEEIISPSTPARENFLTIDMLSNLQSEVSDDDKDDKLVTVRSIAIEEAEQEILITLPNALQAVNPDLYRLWKGAWDSFNSDNPDRIRHSLTSARELVTHVLHALAPDEEVKSWSTDRNHYHNDKPTRRARILYLFAPIERKHLMTKYLYKETEACLELIDILNVGTHSILPQFSDNQIRMILRKVHSMICTLVEVRNARN